MIELLVLIAGIAALTIVWKSREIIADSFRAKAIEYKAKVIKTSTEELAKTTIPKETEDKAIEAIATINRITAELNK